MAYEQGTATDKEDFIDQLTTFASNNGWTLDEFDSTNDKATISINSVFVTFRWDANSSGGIAVFQSLAFTREAVSATVSAGGTGYTVGDDITISGGTFETAAVFNVDSVSGGVVTGVSLVTAGKYSALPSNPASTTGGTGSGCTLTVTYQTVDPDEHIDDSGAGDPSGTITTERRLSDTGNGPFVNHWFFASNEDGNEYLYAVLEHDSGIFKMFGAGEMVKFGTWTGGEFCGATTADSSFDVQDARHNFICDGRNQTANNGCTVHCENLPSQTVGGKWAACMFPNNPGVDGNGTSRALFTGGMRDGFLNYSMQGMVANPNNGFIPMVPMLLFYRTNSGDDWRFMGKLPHMRELNGRSLIAGEEFTIGGSETWKVFPASRKASSGTPRSRNLFIAFRKIV